MAGEASVLTAIALQAKATWGYPSEWLEQWREALTLSPVDLDRMIVRVAVDRGTPVGFGAVDRIAEGWEVAHLWVLPSHGRRGIGGRLLSALANAARGAGAATLRIESDPHAAEFYERAGAVRIGAVPAPMPGVAERVLVVFELRIVG
ncbi:MAG TPA: GNAT family N-acetyltransferase [Gemmatimonadaceae bacterium]|nr:GNAT family N-acetyltransferase [Gemmatimonadaceae bacterium]